MLLQADAIDAVVVSSPENVTYVSEYWGLSHWARRGTQVYAIAWNGVKRSVDVIVPAALADLVTNDVASWTRPHAYGCFVLEASECSLTPEDQRILSLATWSGNETQPLKVLAELLRRGLSTGGRVAIERTGFTDGFVARLEEDLRGIELLPAESLLAASRAVKSNREIELLRQAAMITETAVLGATCALEAGATEHEIAQRFRQEIVVHGALPETTVIGSGPRSALPNALPGHRSLQEGDVLRFDVGCRYEHYVSDIARTFVWGRASQEQHALYAALSQGLESAAHLLRPGIRGSDVFAAAVDTVQQNALPAYSRTHCGHGIGIANYDLPRISPDSEDVLQPGMVVCLETPYYRLGSFGLQVEDTFVITFSGAERITRVPEELPIIGR